MVATEPWWCRGRGEPRDDPSPPAAAGQAGPPCPVGPPQCPPLPPPPGPGPECGCVLGAGPGSGVQPTAPRLVGRATGKPTPVTACAQSRGDTGRGGSDRRGGEAAQLPRSDTCPRPEGQGVPAGPGEPGAPAAEGPGRARRRVGHSGHPRRWPGPGSFLAPCAQRRPRPASHTPWPVSLPRKSPFSGRPASAAQPPYLLPAASGAWHCGAWHCATAPPAALSAAAPWRPIWVRL